MHWGDNNHQGAVEGEVCRNQVWSDHLYEPAILNVLLLPLPEALAVRMSGDVVQMDDGE